MSADLRSWRKSGASWNASAHNANHRQEERAKEQEEGLKPGQKLGVIEDVNLHFKELSRLQVGQPEAERHLGPFCTERPHPRTA